VEIRTITQSNLEDEVSICVPPKDSPNYPKFERGIREKIGWLQQKIRGYGYIGNLAYNSRGEPLGFIEFVPAEDTPIPIEDATNTALITCIYLPKMQGQGIGTKLLRATLKQLWKIGVRQAKTLVSRSPKWINDGVYRRQGFQLEKTFYKHGNPEPLDLLTFSLYGSQLKTKPVIQHLKPQQKDSLPVEVVYFHSAQCPFGAIVHRNHVNAIAKFGADQVTFKVIDSWKQPELAKQYGSMYSDTFINGRAPFFAPPKQEEIETEIQKEINRVLRLQSKKLGY
jgi:GNAT superfamily N-acetyltransferase